jgi:TRAP-type C4-dicarboxylate transport system permease small subunit
MEIKESLWLGSLRGPVKLAMTALVVALLGMAAWLIFGRLVLGTGVGMNEFLRPGDHTAVKATLWLVLATLVVSGIYLSDSQGMIEQAPTGPFDILSLVLSRIAMIAVAAIVVVMFYEVIARYVFSKPTLWANELSLWIAAFVFILAGLYAMQQRSHIRIYVIYDLMPRWAKKLSDIITVVLIWGFWAALVWGGYNEARDKLLRMETFGTAWDPPIPATVKVTMLIVIGLVALQALSNLVADWNKEPHRGGTDEIDEHEIEQLKHALGTDKNG